MSNVNEKDAKEAKEEDIKMEATPKPQQEQVPENNKADVAEIKKEEEEAPKKVESSSLSINVIKEVSCIPQKPTIKDLVIYKTIIIENNGAEAWPQKCHLTQVSKEVIGHDCKLVSLAPNKQMAVVLIIDSPRKGGKFTSTWRLAKKEDGEETQFIGEPINVEFEISEPEKKPLIFGKPEPVPIKKEYSKQVI